MQKTITRSEQLWANAIREKTSKGLSLMQAKRLVAREKPGLRRSLLVEANIENTFAISQIKEMV